MLVGLRARQTLEYLRFAAGTEVAIESSLYGAAAASLLTRIGRIPSGVGSAVLIAHNPGLEELARILAGAGNDLAAADKFPTAAVAGVPLPDPDVGRGWARTGGTGRTGDVRRPEGPRLRLGGRSRGPRPK